MNTSQEKPRPFLLDLAGLIGVGCGIPLGLLVLAVWIIVEFVH